MNNKRRMRVQSLALGLSFSIVASSAALADDISIYITPPIEPINPNVLFVLDESGSMAWGDDWETLPDTDPRQRLFQLKSSLREIINSPDSDEVNAAIMGYQGVSSDTCPQPEKLGFGCFVPGVNLRAPFLGIGDNRETLLEAVDALTHDGGTPTTSAVHDAIQWYKEGYDHHESPIEFWCQPNYVVLLSDGEPNFNSRAHNGWGYEHNDLDRGQPCDVRRETTGVNFGGGTGTPQDGRCTPDFVRYAAETDLRTGAGWDDIQNVTTHAIGFHTNERTQTFLRYTAEEGGGNFFTADNSSALTEIITGIVSEAQASIPYAYNQTAIPFDSSNAATSENEIYVPLFLPEPKSFWRGNLKKYSLRINDDGSLSLLDAAGNAVLDSNGNFLDDSRSLWSASADGDSPVSGGAASHNTGARNLFTYIAGGTSSTALSSHRLFDFTDTTAPALGGTANADITNSAMGVSSDAERADLLQWISTGQGYMGAPLHTHPTVIHYGSGNTVVYLLTSEGVLQAIDASTGDELWAYMPDELLGNVATIKHVVENPDENGFSGAPLYGLDGELTVVHDDANGNTIVDGGERVLAVFGMRRGGDNYYAIDISNRTNPSFAWEMIGGEGDFSRLGQTWAKAQLVKMELGASARDVLIIAGGYDSDQDAVTGGRAADTVGNAVYIVDAWNGRRLWWASNAGADLNIASMTNSVAASTNAIDVNGNGTADRIYLADTGGRIIRIDFFGSASAVAMHVSTNVRLAWRSSRRARS